jgi:phospholipase/lecithinase/hemolysin
MALLLFTLSGHTLAEVQYDSFYGFGDSLADTGNVFILSSALGADPAPPPSVSPHRAYFAGRFSNGPVAFEYFWQMLSGKASGTPGGLVPFLASPLKDRGAVNFAFGGTGTRFVDRTPGGLYAPGLKGQVELFRALLRGRKPSRRALFAIVTGSNDYRDDAFHQPLTPPESVQNTIEAIETLYALGAREMMALNLPDLGLVPANRADPLSATQLSMLHNALLAQALHQLEARLPKLNLIQVDLFQVPDRLPPGMDLVTPALDVFFPPASLPPGFVMSACLFINPVTCADAPTFDVGNQFLFWDVVHPTTAAHRVIGEFLHASLGE